MYDENEAKAGVKKRHHKRRELVPEELFADLLRGVLRKSGRGENAGAGGFLPAPSWIGLPCSPEVGCIEDVG